MASPEPVAAAPSAGAGARNVLKIIVGLLAWWLLTMALMAYAHAGYGVAALIALALAGSVLMVLWGAFGLAKRELVPMALVIPGLVLLLVGIGGRWLSGLYWESRERTRWNDLVEAMNQPDFVAGRWAAEYEQYVPERFWRDEWRVRWMQARLDDAAERRSARELRAILRDIEAAPDPTVFTDVREAVVARFVEHYERAKSEMYAPPPRGTTREFPVDPKLREAFATILEELAHTSEPTVYVAFRSTVGLEPPPGTEQELDKARNEPLARATFPDGAPIIDPSAAFSPAYDDRRHRTFTTAMSESFGRVFDADLLTLAPLGEAESRDGKLVIEVSATVSRLPQFFSYRNDDGSGRPKLAGLLFGIAVDWELALRDRSGDVLFSSPTVHSEPAGTINVATSPDDPSWGLYSVLMDSAYYNYSRQVTGMFGLEPPPVKTEFVYEESGEP